MWGSSITIEFLYTASMKNNIFLSSAIEGDSTAGIAVGSRYRNRVADSLGGFARKGKKVVSRAQLRKKHFQFRFLRSDSLPKVLTARFIPTRRILTYDISWWRRGDRFIFTSSCASRFILRNEWSRKVYFNMKKLAFSRTNETIIRWKSHVFLLFY